MAPDVNYMYLIFNAHLISCNKCWEHELLALAGYSEAHHKKGTDLYSLKTRNCNLLLQHFQIHVTYPQQATEQYHKQVVQEDFEVKVCNYRTFHLLSELSSV